MSIFIIFLDGETMGYLEDENITRTTVSNLADTLICKLKELPGSSNNRIFRENTSDGIKIYSQATGTFINGIVNLQHTIQYKSLPKYSYIDERDAF